MVEDQLRNRGIRDERILEAFLQVPRELFAHGCTLDQAYSDSPQPIGHGQTISQPYIVALMIEKLQPESDDRILDIGLGSGYQTALLAKLAGHVYAIERVQELAERATEALAATGIDNVTTCTGDGTLGWPEEAPFDGIICGAAGPSVPDPWRSQLADGGRVVIPVGSETIQELLVCEKQGDQIRKHSFGGVRFVKLIGEEGWQQSRPR
jgi:protein-L-isoaspartate(D-aspartate) O-methyltransferase